MMNPMQMIRMIRSSGNQQQITILNQAEQMVHNKNKGEVRQLAMNMARERGVDINALAGQMGLKLPE